MNDLETALYRDLTDWLVDERLPSGRPMTTADWWTTYGVAERIGADPLLLHPDRPAGLDLPRARPAGLS